MPTTRDAAALSRRQPDEDIDALRASTPLELGTGAGLVPLYLRAEAYRQKGWLPESLRQYGRLLDFRGVDPLSPVVPLALLGAARAHAGTGDVASARRTYETLLAIWEQADADLPALAAARAEYARLPAADAARP